MKRLFAATMVALASPSMATPQVYKCLDQGKVMYSHEPCVGAVAIDTTPTRGADSLSGKSRKGAEVQRLEMREGLADALQPITGMDRAAFLRATHRQKLSPHDRAECERLDAVLPKQTQAVQIATSTSKTRADVELYKSRKRFNDLNCE